MYNNEVIKKLAVKFFSTLYTSDMAEFQPYSLTGCFPHVNAEMLHMLWEPMDDDEIRLTSFNMKPLKDPGVDGLHAMFYQWSVN